MLNSGQFLLQKTNILLLSRHLFLKRFKLGLVSSVNRSTPFLTTASVILLRLGLQNDLSLLKKWFKLNKTYNPSGNKMDVCIYSGRGWGLPCRAVQWSFTICQLSIFIRVSGTELLTVYWYGALYHARTQARQVCVICAGYFLGKRISSQLEGSHNLGVCRRLKCCSPSWTWQV